MRTEVRGWWGLSNGDLQKANDNFNIGNYDLSSFLCQQAVKKYSKDEAAHDLSSAKEMLSWIKSKL